MPQGEDRLYPNGPQPTFAVAADMVKKEVAKGDGCDAIV